MKTEIEFKGDNMKYPHYSVYERLYKRFFDKGVQYLLDEAELNPEDNVLDICGGNGRLTRELIKLCNRVSYLDREVDMIPADLEQLGIQVYNDTVENWVNNAKEKYDKVFCEQAVNYWLLTIDMNKFSSIFKQGGVFVFNTFSRQPPKKPLIKEYVIDGLNYLEVSYLVDNKVHHIQVCEGYEPHFTIFDWISKEQYIDLLSPYFDVKIKEGDKSALYICKRK